MYGGFGPVSFDLPAQGLFGLFATQLIHAVQLLKPPVCTPNGYTTSAINKQAMLAAAEKGKVRSAAVFVVMANSPNGVAPPPR